MLIRFLAFKLKIKLKEIKIIQMIYSKIFKFPSLNVLLLRIKVTRKSFRNLAKFHLLLNR